MTDFSTTPTSADIKYTTESTMIKLRPARLSINTVLTIVLLVVLIISEKWVEPVHRGFFCGDHSIMKPYVSDQTVPVAVLLATVVVGTILVVVCTEIVTRKTNRETATFKEQNVGYIYLGTAVKLEPWMYRVLSHLCFILIGCTMSTLFTNVGKKFVGRLRPHFIAVCQPDYNKFNCSDGYITLDVCTTSNMKALRQARLSFPSGHSSLAMFTSVLLMFYIEFRVNSPRFTLIKPFVQFILLTLGVCCCYTRISDYWHHWSDVVAGSVIGVMFAVYTVFHMMRLHQRGSFHEDSGYVDIREGGRGGRSRYNTSPDIEEGRGGGGIPSYANEGVN